ncbi:GGDEF domain-containing protein [Thermomonas sp. HDW16]|uniref:sensor domain-containing diguanylate cyclase n=1 Tax=Thermomonas sp. HDW16 TaxID=2714945 RepID=UPI00140A4B4B|nr:GGDEF domain-containing protein [Thermomonas sp. HDW16]QIL21324.1 diguanylate cyclase [Thermomonas sp. HDW16]
MLAIPSVSAAFDQLGDADAQGLPVHVENMQADALDHGRLKFAGGPAQARRVHLDVNLPVGDQRWMLWFARDPVDMVKVSGKGWALPETGFFRPTPSEGLLLAGYGFALPHGVSGPQRLTLELASSMRTAPEPRVLREQDVLRYAGRELALAYGVYAALLTLLIAALALYPAVRDSLFLLFSLYTASALVFMASSNGHLFAMPGMRAFGGLGAAAYWLVLQVFSAIALSVVLNFADVRNSQSPWVRRLEKLPILIWGLALLSLIPIPAISDFLQVIGTLVWVAAIAASIVAMMDGLRRGIPMALATVAALFALMVASSAHEAMQRAWIADGVLSRHGYQFALVLVSVILFVGASSRIGMVRKRLAVESSARRDSEDRLRLERMRTGFVQSMQDELRAAPADEIATRAFRLLCRQVCDLLGLDDALVLGHGTLGQELLLVQAGNHQVSPLAQSALVARGVIRMHAQNREPVHVRIEGARISNDPSAPQYAIVPIRTASPAWAALMVPVQAAQGLGKGVLNELVELARVAVAHAEEAYAAIQLRKTAEYDALTGSLNRRSLDQALAREFKARDAQALSVLFIDIDWFKRINDEHGHACGDHCLRSVAATLRAELRPNDALGRYGGEEFLVLLPGHDAAASRVIAERLRQQVEQAVIEWQGGRVPLTISVGMAARRDSDRDAPTLLDRADKALYAAKHEGRNRVCVAPAAFV